MAFGFAGDPDALITTADTARRLGYALTPDGKPGRTWYNEARRRRAAGFPTPIRRGLYRLGDLQAWSAAGGFRQSPPAAPSSPESQPAASQAPGDPLAPRPELAGRLRLLVHNR